MVPNKIIKLATGKQRLSVVSKWIVEKKNKKHKKRALPLPLPWWLGHVLFKRTHSFLVSRALL